MADATSTETSPTDPAAAPTEIVARAGTYYRNARYLMALICFGLAGWFGYDGWVRYPAQNDAYDAAVAAGRKPEASKHTDLDITTQQLLALSLPFVGVGIIAWLLYNSRGEVRLAGDVLHVPGHPPVPLDDIREIDRAKWEKKGIAFLDYETTDPATSRPAKGTLVLDAFVYQQDPVDAIFAEIERR
ncbi:MAG TPA: hypothetical protein VF796_06880, partial [Humisphaera sp.]